jgi:hypothetical protein
MPKTTNVLCARHGPLGVGVDRLCMGKVRHDEESEEPSIHRIPLLVTLSRMNREKLIQDCAFPPVKQGRIETLNLCKYDFYLLSPARSDAGKQLLKRLDTGFRVPSLGRCSRLSLLRLDFRAL